MLFNITINMTTIEVHSPQELLIQKLTSSGDNILRRRLSEVGPSDGAGTYGSGGNSYKTTFNLSSSGTEFLDGTNSYFRCVLDVNSATTTANSSLISYLDEGGIHAMIKNVYIKLRNGTDIESLQDYNKLYAMISNATMSPHQVNSVESMQSGDSMGYHPIIDPDDVQRYGNTILPADYNGAADRYPYAATQLAAITASAFTAAAAGAPTNAELRTEFDRVGNNVRTLANTELAKFRANSILSKVYITPRQKFADGTAHTVTFKLMSNFLNHLKYIPLPMLQQLQIVIEWERPSLAYFVEKITTATGAPANLVDAEDTLNYTISEFRFVQNLVEPHSDVLEAYSKAWNSEGIEMAFPTYKNFHVQLPAGTSFSKEIPGLYNSVRHILFGIMSAESYAENGNAKGFPSQSIFRKNNLKNWVIRCGGVRYPDHGPVDASTTYSPETFTQLMLSLNQHNNKLLDTRIKFHEWDSSITRTWNGVGGNNSFTDSTKFIMGVDMSRHDDFTGQSTNGNPLVVELNFDPAAVATEFVAFVCVDTVLTLNKNSAFVRY